ncbi:MAG: CoA transferase, partial [Chloroflexi bacterium]|nr:CoA transferase [Chloroflexota bacterium]
PGERPWERGASFNYTGRNKHSVTMDLERELGRSMFLRLIACSDVLLENNAAGTLEKLGLTYPVLHAANPRLIHLSFPGYGNSGPYKYYKGYGANVEAVLGHTSLRGYPDMDPTGATPVFQADAAAGAMGAFAILTALRARSRSGRGQFIDMSQAEVMAHQINTAIMDYSMNGRAGEPLGNRDRTMAPHGAYKCRDADPAAAAAGMDDWVVIAVATDAEFAALCDVMGRSDLAADPRFAGALARHDHQDDLDPIISAWTADQDKYDVMNALQAAGVAAGAVLTPRDVLHDPHIQAREFYHPVTRKYVGTYQQAGPLYKLSGTPLTIGRPAPTLGEHNEYVYRDLLGVTDEEWATLEREGYIGDRYTEA